MYGWITKPRQVQRLQTQHQSYSCSTECQEILKGLSLGESKQCRHEDRGFGPVIINIVCVGVTLREYEVAGSMESSKSSPPERIVEKELGRRDASPIVV